MGIIKAQDFAEISSGNSTVDEIRYKEKLQQRTTQEGFNTRERLAELTDKLKVSNPLEKELIYQEKIDILKEKITFLQNRLEEVNSGKEQLIAEIKQQDGQLAVFRQENNNLQQQLGNNGGVLQKAVSQKEELGEQIKLLQRELKIAENSADKSQAKSRELQEALVSLEQKLKEERDKNSTVKSKLESLNRIRAEYQEEKVKLYREASALREEITNLKSSEAQLAAQLNQLTLNYQQANADLAMLKQQHAALSESEKKAKGDADHFKKELVENKFTLSNLSEELKQKSVQVADLLADNERKGSELLLSATEAIELKSTIAAKDSQLLLKKNEVAALEKRAELSKQKEQELFKEQQRLQNILVEEKEALQQKQELIDELQLSIAAKEASYSQKEMLYLKAQGELELLQANFTEQKILLAKAEKDLANSESVIKRLSTEQEQLLLKYNNEVAVRKDLENKNKQLQFSTETTQKELAKKAAQLNVLYDEVATLRDNEDSLKGQLATKENALVEYTKDSATLDKLKEELRALHEKNETLEQRSKELEVMEKEYNLFKRDGKREFKELHTQFKVLQEGRARDDKELKRLYAKIEELQKQIDAAPVKFAEGNISKRSNYDNAIVLDAVEIVSD